MARFWPSRMSIGGFQMVVVFRRLVVLLVAAVVLGAGSLVGSPAEAATTRSVSWPAGWGSPLSSRTVNVTVNYGAYDLGCANADRSHEYTYYLPEPQYPGDPNRSEHLAVDLAAPSGAGVYAIADGRILRAGVIAEEWGSGSREIALVEHFATNGDRFTAVYAHIQVGTSPITRQRWQPGDVVRRGNQIGKIVLAGTGYHLHFGLAPGAKTLVPPTSETSGTGNCVRNARGTVDPIAYLANRSEAPLTRSIVGRKNSDGSVTSWRVVSASGVLRRQHIETEGVYWCMRNQGVVDRGPMPSRFLDQLPVRAGSAICSCLADTNVDGRIDIIDLSRLLSDWGTSNRRSDANRDRIVDIADLSILLSSWGQKCRGSVTQFGSAMSGSGTVAVLSGLGGDAEAIGRSTDGVVFGNAAPAPGASPVAAVWPGPGSQPSLVMVPGLTDLVMTDVNSNGVAVGGAVRGTGGDAAWYRLANGQVGELDPDGADRAFALAVDDRGRVAGYLFKGQALPVVWESVTSEPRYLLLPSGIDAAAVTAMNDRGVAAGALVDDRLAIWSDSQSVIAPVADGEAVAVNAAGDVLFGSASVNTAEPRVRLHDGRLVSLADVTGQKGQLKRALVLTNRGRIGGAHGKYAVVWPTGGAHAKSLAMPVGGTEGAVLGLTDEGRAFGWVDVSGTRRAAMWTGIDLSVPTPPVTESPSPAAQPTVKVKTPRKAKLKINVNPDLPGKTSWKVLILKKKQGQFVKVKKVRTQGPREIVKVDMPRGRYKVRVPTQKGYEEVTSRAVGLRR